MSQANLLIRPTGEVISIKMSKHIIALFQRGCTEECIPCHFKEVWHRELDQDSVSAVLEEDTEYTFRPVPNGETLLSNGHTLMPNGIISEMIRLGSLAGDEFIAIYLTLRYPELRRTFTERVVNLVLNDVSEQWITGWDGSLPTTPVTPRNHDRPRSSHRTPPPNYSRSRPEGHPRQVLAPLALLERPRTPPPAYPSPPSYEEQESEFSADVRHVGRLPHRTPVDHALGRSPPRLFNRPSRPAAIEIPRHPAEHPQLPAISPPAFRPNRHLALVSPLLHRRPIQRRTPVRQSSSPDFLQPTYFRSPIWGSREPENDLERGSPIADSPTLPSEDVADIDFWDGAELSPRLMPMHRNWDPSETVILASPRYGPTDSGSSSSSSPPLASPFIYLGSDDDDDDGTPLSSPDSFANFRARQREAR